MLRFLILPLALCFLPLSALANPEENPEPEEEKAEKEEKKNESKPADAEEEVSAVTHHSGRFGDEQIGYTATAGTLIISREEEEAPKASMFYVAYTKDDVTNPGERPIVYCFNGGPGSSAVWLHLGGFGPKRVAMTPDGQMPKPPFRLTENPESILRVADLVFIDPVSTGYSRANKKKEAKQFHGFRGDLESMAEFIRLYTTRNERWLSPKFLAGESYGAFRAAGLAYVLQEDFGLYLNGLILVSGVLGFDTIWGTDLAYVNFLPALSEVAAYHGRLEDELLQNPKARREEVQAFASGDYANALLQGLRLDPDSKQALAEQMARFIGLDAATVERHDLRISPTFFREHLLRDQSLILGRFDARITAKDGDLTGDSPVFDPSYSAVYGPFSATLNDYIRRELEFESDLVYEILSDRVRPWNYGDEFVGQPVSIASRLAKIMTMNPTLQILVNCGQQDLATPCTAMRHTFDHLDIDAELLENVHYTSYEGGHMMYTIEQSNAAWNQDVAAFIEAHSGLGE